MKTATAILIGGLSVLAGGLAASALLPDKERAPTPSAGGPAVVKRETERVKDSALAFSRAVSRHEARLICAHLITPETRARIEVRTGKRCVRFYRELPQPRGRPLIDRTRIYGPVAMLDVHNTSGTSGVLIFLRSSAGAWLFLRRLERPPDSEPRGRDAAPQGQRSSVFVIHA